MTLEELIETYPEAETYFKKHAGRIENPLHHPEISAWDHHPSERLSPGLFRDRMQWKPPGDQ